MKLLVGNTGLIGNTLKDFTSFDYEYNSKNIQELQNLSIDNDNTIYLSCLPATKWLINQNPLEDLENINNIIKILEQKEYKNIVLYSTIDIYNNSPTESNEDLIPSTESPDYGSNRYIFEILVRERLKYDNLLIIRLPALFGKHIKKNIIYDLINKNQIDKIKFNSTFQWYNLDNLFSDTVKYLDQVIISSDNFLQINLFSEPIPTSKILKIFNIDKCEVDTISTPPEYNYKTKFNENGYAYTKEETLKSLKKFVFNIYYKPKLKIAVCLFGEERDLLPRLPHWKSLSSKFDIGFHIALYSHDNIYNSLHIIKQNLTLKSSQVVDNDLGYFNQLKFKAKNPIYIYGLDRKATFDRITSQLNIRQKAVSLVDKDKYDLIILCRTDFSYFNISEEDISNCVTDKDMIVVNSGCHSHPGGGGGCTKCTIENRCNEEYHANDICDYWCMGSPKAMEPWVNVFDNCLDLYNDIQQSGPKLEDIEGVHYTEYKENNEIIFGIRVPQLLLIENYIHCYYPEKIMRSAFKDKKIINATHSTKLWE
jgi:hypothetical protein